MTLAFRVILGLGVLSCGCGAQAFDAAKVASGIEATKDLYRAACTHEPVSVPKDVCDKAKPGINTVVDFYNAVNDKLPE